MKEIAEADALVVFKIVARWRGKLWSIFDGCTEYEVGRLMEQEVRPRHKGGFYAYGSKKAAERAKLPRRSRLKLAPRAILRCLGYGRRIRYKGGKLAFSKLLPQEVLPCSPGYCIAVRRGAALKAARSQLLLAAPAAQRKAEKRRRARKPVVDRDTREATQSLEAEVADMEQRLTHLREHEAELDDRCPYCLLLLSSMGAERLAASHARSRPSSAPALRKSMRESAALSDELASMVRRVEQQMKTA
eukprot:PLAT8515.1.p1 GENE.PLAT8515.1~~PLAT8515.1.p1  ORF type:complete len:260 (+),score=61.35 PLAT8515.1:43-780(+)